jgi:hypothetical protein
MQAVWAYLPPPNLPHSMAELELSVLSENQPSMGEGTESAIRNRRSEIQNRHVARCEFDPLPVAGFMQMDYSLPEQFLVAAWRAAWPPAQPARVVVSRAICKTIDASFDYALVCA